MESLLVQFLSPFLPRLLGKAHDVGQELADRTADVAWDYASRIWERLRPRLESRPGAPQAAEEVAKAPEDTDAADLLRLHLKKLLADDPQLVTDLRSLLDEANSAGVMATGEKSVAAGSIHAETKGIAGGIIHGGVHQVNRGDD
ncbi:MAG TPA: hypothetical protein VK867_12010 [Candidatus Limnocylindrales bacterium]|nr:hypothetical protein [Candidatus Limnocylindrales bacterium]